MIVLRGLVFLAIAMAAAAAAAKDGSMLNIPQVSNTPRLPEDVGNKEKEALLKEQELMNQQQQDYQSQVINNPKFSDYGRANAVIKMNEEAAEQAGATPKAIRQDAQPKVANEDQMGSNIAVIRQEGAANSSSITQTGKKNKAVQIQKGTKNDLSVTQQGDHNTSYEEQIGKYNHKKKVQNGILTETDETNN